MYYIIDNSKGSIGISSIILIIGVLLIVTTVGSVLTESSHELTEEDITTIVEDAVNEITSYIQIKSVLGKYYLNQNSYTIQKIIILITPLFHGEYDLSDLIIQLQTKNSITDMYNNEQSTLPKGDLFSDKNWEIDQENLYSCLISLDKDDSVNQFNTLNDPTDMIYLTINIPEHMYLYKGDTMRISLIAGTGVMRSVYIKAPLPTSMIVEL